MPDGRFSSDPAFRAAVDEILRALLEQIDALDTDDIDARLTEGNLQVSFDSGGTFVLSQQTPTHELWLSANLTAWHFVRREDRWRERDSNEPMLGILARLFAEKIGQPVTFKH